MVGLAAVMPSFIEILEGVEIETSATLLKRQRIRSKYANHGSSDSNFES